MDKFDNRYKFIKSLGSGLSGEVLLVEDDEGQKALKMLKRVQFKVSKEEALKNFKSEFSILSELNHPGIGRILDFGFEPRLKKYYFSTEFIQGEDIFKATKNLDLSEIEDVVVQVLRALNYLHSRGIFHFDIKPQNILTAQIDHKVVAKIIDFGLAGFGPPKKKVGTPSYMAPEVILGGDLDGRTDLYSFGVVLYKILTRQNPFADKKVEITLDRQKNFTPPIPSEINQQIPRFWDQIVMRLLEKTPSERYPDASLVIRDINFLANKKYDIETKDTRLSYLPEKGSLIGRDQQTAKFQNYFQKIFKESDLTVNKLFVIKGQNGTGKTRLLSEFKYYAQLNEAKVYSWSEFNEVKIKGEVEAPFLLEIDTTDQIHSSEILQLLQVYSQKEVGIIWATIEVPKGWSDIELIELSNFSVAELSQYLSQVTGLEDPPQKLVEEIYNRSQGNPLFVSELLKTLLAENLLLDSSGRWVSSTFEDIGIDFDKIHVPSSVSELVKQQYINLSGEEKKILEWLSLANESLFSYELSDLIKDYSQGILLNLINYNLIERDDSGAKYFFKNYLFQEVIYDGLPYKKKLRMHDEYAQYLSQKGKPQHKIWLHQGYGSNVELAVNALDRLSDYYLQHEDTSKAINALNLAWEKCQELSLKIQFNTRRKLAFSLSKSRKTSEAIAHYEKLKDQIDQYLSLVDIEERVEIYEKLGELYARQDKHELALKLFERALKWIKGSLDDQFLEIIIQNNRALIFMKIGKIDQAEELFKKNRIIWEEELDDSEKSKVTNNWLVDLYILKGDFDLALEQIEIDIPFFEKIKNGHLTARAYYLRGDIYYRQMLGETDQKKKSEYKDKAILGLSKCLGLAKEIKSKDLLLRTYNGIGNLYFQDDELKQAQEYYERALAIARQLEDFFTAAFISLNLGNILRQKEAYRDAYAYAVYTLNIIEGLSSQNANTNELKLRSLIEMAETCRHLNDLNKAESLLSQAEKLLISKKYLSGYEFAVWFQKAELFYRQGHFALSRDCIKKSKSLAKQSWEKEELNKFENRLDENERDQLFDISVSESSLNKVDDSSSSEKSLLISKIDALSENQQDLIGKVINYISYSSDSNLLVSIIHDLTQYSHSNLKEKNIDLSPAKEMSGVHKNKSQILIDHVNYFDPELKWKDYEELIIFKSLALNEFNKKETAKQLDISISGLYQKINRFQITKHDYKFEKYDFEYDKSMTMRNYNQKVFLAAKNYCHGKTYRAIKLMDVSPGYFYNILKEASDEM